MNNQAERLTISGEHLTSAMLDSAIAILTGSANDEVTKPEFWQAKGTQEYLLQNLPSYLFSKFQQVLPDRYALEMVQGYLLDIEGIGKLKIDRTLSTSLK